MRKPVPGKNPQRVHPVKRQTELPNRIARKTKQPAKLTLYDILSHLTWRQASEILGDSGSEMLRHPFDLPEINLDQEVFLSNDLCRINVFNEEDQTVPVTITLAPHGKKHLIVKCHQCGNEDSLTSDCCVHVAAALSFDSGRKSLIGLAELLAQLDSIKKVLIVCPATVKSQWKNEIKRFTNNRSAQLILGSSAERLELYNGPAFFTICNYEQVLRDLSFIENTS